MYIVYINAPLKVFGRGTGGEHVMCVGVCVYACMCGCEYSRKCTT